MDANARLLMDAGKALGASRAAMRIALATAAQESSMGTNTAAMSRANRDGDVGWFQQRTTRGDGTIAQLLPTSGPARDHDGFFYALLEKHP